MINFQPANPQQQEMPVNVNPANARRRRALAEALSAAAPKTVQNTGQGLAMMGMQAAGGLIDGMTERREQAAEQQRRIALADGLIGSFGDQLPGNMKREQFRAFAIANPEGAAKMGMEMLLSRLKPQERFETITLPDGRQAQRSSLTGKIEPMSEGRGPMTVAPGASVLDPRTNQPVFTAPNRPDILSPEALAQQKAIAEAGSSKSNPFQDRAATTTANRFDKLASAAQAAAGNASNFQMLRELNKLAPTGPLQGRIAELMPNATTAGAAFTAIINQIAPTLRVEGSGATSDMEMNLFMQSLPRLRNTPQTNEALIGFMERKAQLDIQRGTIAQRALRGEMPPADAERELERLNSVSLLTPEIRGALGIPEPQPQGGPPPPPAPPPAPVPMQGPPQGQPVQQGPQQPQQAPPPPITLDALDAEIMRKQQILEQQQRAQQSQMGVAP